MTLEPHAPIHHIPHYYGDAVRQLFLCAAAAMLIGAPFYTDWLRGQIPFIIVGAVVLVFIASVINPYKQSAFFAGSVASGVGLVIYEVWALYGYQDVTAIQFILRQAIAILFLVGFYFSTKTVRAFILHRVGKHDEAGEFDDEPPSYIKSAPRKQATIQDDFLPWFMKKGSGDERRNAPAEDTPARQSPGRSKKELYPTETPYEEIL